MLTPSKGSSQRKAEMIGTSKPDQWCDQSAQPVNLTFFPSVFTLFMMTARSTPKTRFKCFAISLLDTKAYITQ
jgi:hypothetical protein